LFGFDGLEERPEVALAEAAAAVALNDLEEHGGTVLDRPREDLQEIPLVVAIDEDAELADLVHRLANLADPRGEVLVIVVRHPEELDAVGAELRQRLDDVAAVHRDVLHPRRAIEVQ